VDLEGYREEFPVLARKAYLISASLGPVSRRSLAYLDEYVTAWTELGSPEPVWFERIFPRLREVKRSFARLTGAEPDELAITTNVSLALSTIASCLDFPPQRNRVIISELDFPTEFHVWRAQERRGADVVVLPSPDGLTVPVEAYARAIDDRTAVACVNRVLYRSSALLDATAICRLAAEAGAVSVVDDFHGAGIVPVDVRDLGCDFYTTGVLKWLCGGPGLAVVYARRDRIPSLAPLVTGWWGQADPFAFDTGFAYHPSARRLETGTHPAPVAFIAQGGLDLILEVGPEAIRERQGDLTESVIDRADAAGIPVRTPRDRKARGGTVNLRVGPNAAEIEAALYARDVCVDARGDGIRVAPHFFNDERDLDRLFEALGALLQR